MQRCRIRGMDHLEAFLAELRPLLERTDAAAAYLFGSHARGDADAHSDIDVIVVAPSERSPVDRFRDYLPAIVSAGVGVDLFVYTPEEFAALHEEERPFLMAALEGARIIYEGS
ncbi:MAG: nucleotidyltransferase domain-containing protein [Gemmatimonas sp.]|nr:nucleotidyltransferase domain-containing protein [Gemmatimonas sp.]